MINLSSFYKEDLASKIEQIKLAIRETRCIAFHYCYNKGEADKLIEPYLIVFKWSDWYVFGFCKERQDFRMYKLRCLWNPDDYIIPAVYDSSVKSTLDSIKNLYES